MRLRLECYTTRRTENKKRSAGGYESREQTRTKDRFSLERRVVSFKQRRDFPGASFHRGVDTSIDMARTSARATILSG